MRKSLLLVLVLVSIFALTACGSNEESSTGVFKFTDAVITEGKNLPEKADVDGLTLSYPSSWAKPEVEMGPVFIITKEAGEGSMMPATLTVMKSPSNPEFAKMSVDDYKKNYEETLKAQQVDGIEVVNIEKGKWQGADALYMSYKVDMGGISNQTAIYYYDNGKDAFTILVTSGAEEWEDIQSDINQIIASITFPKK